MNLERLADYDWGDTGYNSHLVTILTDLGQRKKNQK